MSWLALASFALVLVRAVRTVDPYWDTLAYHWPYAARVAGLCDRDCLLLPPQIEHRYDGFPLLFHALQGLLWRVAGTPAMGDLIAVGSVVAVCAYLRWRFTVPLAWSWLALLAVPMVQIHLTSSYVDLPANAALTVALLVVLRMLTDAAADHRLDVAIAMLALGAALGGKLQLAPAALITWFAVIALAMRNPRSIGFERAGNVLVLLLAAGAALILPKLALNAWRFGNPVFPIAVAIGPMRLPGPEAMSQGASLSEVWARHAGPVRWIASVLEFEAFRMRPVPWTVDQAEVPQAGPSYRMGGYFVAYVLSLLGYLGWCMRGSPKAARVTAVIGLAALLCALLPLSHELRYYMFWILLLVSGVLALAHHPGLVAPHKVSRSGVLHAIVLVALASVVAMTGAVYLDPGGSRLRHLLQPVAATVAGIPDGATVCVRDRHRFAILYSTAFHPGRQYRTRSVDGDGPPDCTLRLDLER